MIKNPKEALKEKARGLLEQIKKPYSDSNNQKYAQKKERNRKQPQGLEKIVHESIEARIRAKPARYIPDYEERGPIGIKQFLEEKRPIIKEVSNTINRIVADYKSLLKQIIIRDKPKTPKAELINSIKRLYIANQYLITLYEEEYGTEKIKEIKEVINEIREVTKSYKPKIEALNNKTPEELVNNFFLEYLLLRTLTTQYGDQRKLSKEPTIKHPLTATQNYIRLVNNFLEEKEEILSPEALKTYEQTLLNGRMLGLIISHDSTEDLVSKLTKPMKEFLNSNDQKIVNQKVSQYIITEFSSILKNYINKLRRKTNKDNKYINLLGRSIRELRTAHNKVTRQYLSHKNTMGNTELEGTLGSTTQIPKGEPGIERSLSYKASLMASITKLMDTRDNENDLDAERAKELLNNEERLERLLEDSHRGHDINYEKLFLEKNSMSIKNKITRIIKKYALIRSIRENILEKEHQEQERQETTETKIMKEFLEYIITDEIEKTEKIAEQIEKQTAIKYNLTPSPYETEKEKGRIPEQDRTLFEMNTIIYLDAIAQEAKEKGLYESINFDNDNPPKLPDKLYTKIKEKQLTPEEYINIVNNTVLFWMKEIVDYKSEISDMIPFKQRSQKGSYLLLTINAMKQGLKHETEQIRKIIKE